MNKTKNKTKILLIALLVLLPFVFARVLYHHQSWLPQHKTNRGQLLTPPLTIQQLGLELAATHHRWVLVLVSPGACDSECQQQLHTMQQIQRALGKDMNRLQRVLLTTAAVDPSLQAGLNASATISWPVDATVLTRVLGQPAQWYVIDPLGNIILAYHAHLNPEAMLDDLKYLMGVSNIG